MQKLYTATATATGGREGRVQTKDKELDLAIDMPKALGGRGGEGTNPEQLFAAGYSACFDSALNLVARTEREKIGQTSVTSHVSIGKDDSGFGLSVILEVHIPDISKERAEELVQKAHGVCPYSKATKGNIEVELKVV
ncbi:organic hydroperoxide resistance protein [Metabacillus idriensis]|uniref:Ohr family peroxiredoxin n=1 Tax=Metabacillus idriensis TaxID=324768 RepID=A0A6I2M7A4_9BACI|nr:organic hydroperoxide resistance protein [Metabacillus idriensis]MCM3594765.1 organic hydroperoxide resistance protein [Metabacillus idriensis]MDR0136917.1 organic hydroperoxide resistance protein [Metabacillus idriensis]MRX53214.1 Ohr family peroxiredoxin [Metabacillus idriensis]OHR71985.1 Ohr subfamily peroxiredoxin [Bacillus sp. HMSC76G11]